MSKGKSRKKKQERFAKDFPEGRTAFAKAKRKLGMKKGQVTKHKEVKRLINN